MQCLLEDLAILHMLFPFNASFDACAMWSTNERGETVIPTGKGELAILYQQAVLALRCMNGM